MLHFSIEPLIDLRLLELERGYQPLIALPLGGLELQVMDPMIHEVRFEHLIGYSSHKCFPTLVIRPDRCWTTGAAEHWQMDLLEQTASLHVGYLAKIVAMLHQDFNSLRVIGLHWCWCPRATQHSDAQLR